MHKTIPKRCVLGVFWTAQYVSEIYFTRRRLLPTLWHLFYGYNAFGCICILLTFKNKIRTVSVCHSYILRICSWIVFLLISAKKTRNVHFDLNFIFSLSYKISFADLRSLFMERITYSLNMLMHCVAGSDDCWFLNVSVV